jgi:glucose-6-phosphate dehydrogenase assembly protein OpcA
MEDAVSTRSPHQLLPGGTEVPFADIESTLSRLVGDGRRRRRAPARALTATIVVVGEPARLVSAAEALEQLGEAGGVRTILISEGEQPAPTALVTEHSIAIAGLAPRYIDNAVASLRLSSLPALVWWRGGSVEALDDVAGLADRLVLDTESPDETWARALTFLEETAVTDLRWTRLTRWRALLAHLFDLPRVRESAASFTRLSIDAADVPAARLFAGWLRTSLRWPASNQIAIRKVAADARSPLERVQLKGERLTITLHVLSTRTCLHAGVEGEDGMTRVVPLGDGALTALIGEELSVRTRDLAFERALGAARELQVS